jgi:hypothetical protein
MHEANGADGAIARCRCRDRQGPRRLRRAEARSCAVRFWASARQKAPTLAGRPAFSCSAINRCDRTFRCRRCKRARVRSCMRSGTASRSGKTRAIMSPFTEAKKRCGTCVQAVPSSMTCSRRPNRCCSLCNRDDCSYARGRRRRRRRAAAFASLARLPMQT